MQWTCQVLLKVWFLLVILSLKGWRWSQSYDCCHCPQSSLLFASACCLLGTMEDFIFLYFLSESGQTAKFSVLTLDIGTATYLEKVVRCPLGQVTALHPCCVWLIYGFQELLRNKLVQIHILSYSILFAVLDFEGKQLICPSSISLVFYLLHFFKTDELSLAFLARGRPELQWLLWRYYGKVLKKPSTKLFSLSTWIFLQLARFNKQASTG